MVGIVIGAGCVPDVRDAQLVKQRLDAALEGEEVRAVAVSAEGKVLRLVGKAILARQVNLAQLIEARGFVSVAVVARNDLQHARQDRRAHDGGVLAQRVQNLEGIAQRGILRHADLVIIRRADERVCDDLVVAQRAHRAADGAVEALLLGKAAARGLAAHQRAGDLIVAVEARDLLGNIAVMLHVAAPGRDVDIVAVQDKAEGDEDLAHSLFRKVCAEQGVDLVGLELDNGGRLLPGDHVHHAVHDLAAAKQLHKLAGALDGLDGIHHVEALFIAGGGIGAHAEGAGRAAHGNTVEVGGFEKHHRRIADDLAVRAAHDARDADGLVLVADAEHVRREPALVAVERLDGLALARGAHDDVSALDAAEVKGVHRLAVFEHDVVRDIDDVVDRAHAAVAKPLAHPARGWRDLDVFHHARGVARAEAAVLNVDIDELRDAAAAAVRLGRVQPEGAMERRARLAGETDDGKAVGAVRRDLKLDDGIVKAEDVRHVEARLGVLFL